MSGMIYHDYEKVSESDDYPLVRSSASLQPRASKFAIRTWIITALGASSLSLLSAILGAAVATRWWPIANPLACVGLVSPGSPVVADIPMTYHTVEFEGSFMHESIYRQKGSPEVDAAWLALGVNYNGMSLPDDKAYQTGITKNQVRIREKYGGGYPAGLQGFHHLHCLNLLRQGLWFNYEYYHALGTGYFENSDPVIRHHATHCLDNLRQHLMCTVDVSVFGSVWWRNETMSEAKPFPDFQTKHVCRDFERIRRWAEARQLPGTWPDDFLEQPGQEEGEDVYDGIP